MVSAVITEMRRIDAPALAAMQGAYLREQLETLPGVASVRGRGLLLAAELEPAHDAKLVYQQLLEHGVVTNAVTPTALRFAPPLNVARSEIDEVIAVLRRLLS